MMEKKMDLRKSAKKRRNQRGITLVELLVVLAILALVSAIVVINVLPAADKAAVDTTRIQIDIIENSLDQYRLDMRSYPTTQQGLEALVNVPSDAKNSANYRPGGYLRGGFPLDGWGNEFQYEFPGERGGAYDLYSYGADGEPGGEGQDADIGNWTTE
ncbi:type II secretion system major pseudopilin GspG [Hyphococcus formosus]|uniref:type II secretion system major pseudopilin GspG n=1 Tax=Hyphococcus formosus TaxID=3143534 RepID=UPI00398B7335